MSASRENLAIWLREWLPYALPVLGGLIGVVVVNLREDAYLNPVLAIALGALLGRVAATLILRAGRR